jgi:hypothetical protein
VNHLPDQEGRAKRSSHPEEKMSSTFVRLSLLPLALTLAGCSKGESGKPAPAASASVIAQSASPSPEAGAPAAKASAEPTGKAASYSGTYSVAPASIYISDAKDFAHVKQAKDDPSKHVGEGAISLVVGADGHVTGTIDSGPASPALIDGSLVDGEIRGNVRRKTPSDDGLTGTLQSKVSGDSVDGKLSLAEANAAIVREGKLSLKRK